MSKSEGQKLKLLFLKQILEEKTDENNGMTVNEIIKALKSYGISAERKSIYNDIEALIDFGVDIICDKGQSNIYYVGKRAFELPELKMLADSIASSRFITEKKSSLLIKKIGSLTSKQQASSLYRQVFVENRLKTHNEKIYYNVDAIHNAINSAKQITFTYFGYTVNKEKYYKNNKSPYVCSPYALTTMNNNYYLIGYYEKYGEISSFRVDRMESIKLLDLPRIEGELYKNFKVADYCKKNFSMFSGEESFVTIRFDNSLIDLVLDRFGMEVTIRKNDGRSFEITANIGVSPQFLSWILGLSDKAEILSPPSVRKTMADYISSVAQLYKQ